MRPPTPPPPPRASRELPAIGVNEEEKSHVWFEQGSAQYAGTDATLKSTILSPKDDDEGKSSQWGTPSNALVASTCSQTVRAQIPSDHKQLLLRNLLAV